MYEEVALEKLLPHPQNANRLSRMFAKKLKRNIEELGKYETITVRSHPSVRGSFQVLNGHARLAVLGKLGVAKAKCDIWNVSDSQARLFLAILNRLRGSDVPELRMSLLLGLLQERSEKDLSAHIPETASSLAKVARLPEEVGREEAREVTARPDVIIVDFYLNSEEHRTVMAALDEVGREFGLTDSSQALAKLAELFLERRCAAAT